MQQLINKLEENHFVFTMYINDCPVTPIIVHAEDPLYKQIKRRFITELDNGKGLEIPQSPSIVDESPIIPEPELSEDQDLEE